MIRYLIAIPGALLYRWRGSSLWTPPRPIVQAMIAFPFAGPVLTHQYVALVVFLLTTAALCIGHGQYQSMGKPDTTHDTSSVDFLLKPFFKDDPAGFRHCFAGMALTGLLVTLPAGLFSLHPLLGVSGVLKAVAYVLGARILPAKYQILGDTSEFLTGLAFWGILSFYI